MDATGQEDARLGAVPGAAGEVAVAPPAPTSYWVHPDLERRAGPAPGYAYAGFWIRVLAYLIDLIPLMIVSGILLAPLLGDLLAVILDNPPPPRGSSPATVEAWSERYLRQVAPHLETMTRVSGLLQLLPLAYHVGFWTWRGQTPGMMLVGLRVARESDGSSPGLGRSFLRYIGYLISGFALGIGFIWVAFDSRKQGWHDKIAGTVVVRRSS